MPGLEGGTDGRLQCESWFFCRMFWHLSSCPWPSGTSRPLRCTLISPDFKTQLRFNHLVITGSTYSQFLGKSCLLALPTVSGVLNSYITFMMETEGGSEGGTLYSSLGTGQITMCGHNSDGRSKPCLTCPDLVEGQAPEFDANCLSNHAMYYLNCKSCQNCS